MDILASILQNIFAYSFVSEHSKHFLYFEKKKNLAFFSGVGVDPLPPPPYVKGIYILWLNSAFSSDEILNSGKTSNWIQEHYADRSVNMYISN